MRRILSLLAVLAIACAVFAAEESNVFMGGTTEYYFTEVLSASAGSLVTTNGYTYAWKFASIAYAMPASTTNTLAVSVERDVETNSYQTVYVTNGFGNVETNVYDMGPVVSYTLTNSLVSHSTTNVQSVVVGEPYLSSWMFLDGDRITYTFSNGSQKFVIVGKR